MTHTLEQLRDFQTSMGLDAPEGFTLPEQSPDARDRLDSLSKMLERTAYDLKTIGAATGNDVILLRFRLIIEELAEVAEALVNADPGQVLWEVTDLRYVVEGLAVTLGLDWDGMADVAFDRIHKANMSKLDDDGNPVREPGGKIIKGPNYKKADLSDLVERMVLNQRSRQEHDR